MLWRLWQEQVPDCSKKAIEASWRDCPHSHPSEQTLMSWRPTPCDLKSRTRLAFRRRS
jgi:hypothetical protein